MIRTLFLLLGCLLTLGLSAQCLSGDCKNGDGVYQYKSGAKYTGSFQNGEIHGVGKCEYSDGSVYRGQWEHRYPHGRGVKVFADGSEWSGTWEKGFPVNEAGQIIHNLTAKGDGGSIQNGCLAGDCTDGSGTFAYSDGSKYVGQFKNSQPHGKGVFTDPDGEVYKGQFANGYRHGRGVVIRPNKGQVQGEWRRGEYAGNPQSNYGKEGCRTGNCENGAGVYIFRGGTAKYNGKFQGGKPHGQGLIRYTNGEGYRGEWAGGQPNGEGVMYKANDTEVRGFWKDGTYMGPVEESVPAEAQGKLSREMVSELRQARAAKDMKVWAVLVGVASYNHMPVLRYTDDDAYRMLAFLQSPQGGAVPDEQIEILVDEDATHNNITRAMEDIFGQAGPDDLVLLYFSGHGLDGSFLPIDFDGYQNQLAHGEITRLLDATDARYKLCIADACHSGSLARTPKGSSVNAVLDSYYSTLSQAAPGTALIMSSKSEETSLESSGLRQGVFSHFLIRGLKGEADLNGNKIVTVEELFDFLNSNVRSYTGRRQSPQIRGDYDKDMTVSVVR